MNNFFYRKLYYVNGLVHMEINFPIDHNDVIYEATYVFGILFILKRMYYTDFDLLKMDEALR